MKRYVTVLKMNSFASSFQVFCLDFRLFFMNFDNLRKFFKRTLSNGYFCTILTGLSQLLKWKLQVQVSVQVVYAN